MLRCFLSNLRPYVISYLRRKMYILLTRNLNHLRWQLRTVTSDQTVYNNSSLTFSTRQYDVTGSKLLKSNEFIICFVPGLYLKLRKYYNFGTKNSQRA